MSIFFCKFILEIFGLSMKYIFSILLIILGFNQLFAQKLLHSIAVKNAGILNVDETGHIYIIEEKRTIKKFSIDLEKIVEFRATKNGEIKILDVNNPMEIIFYQPNFNRMTILDRLLSQKFELDFNQYNHQNISCVAQSSDGQYWMYDVLNAQLIKINKQYLETSRSNDLRLSRINDFEPTKLEEYDDGILAFEKGNGYVLFDRYTNVLKSNFDIKNLVNIHLYNHHWIVVYPNEVVIKNFQEDKIFMNFKNENQIIDARVHNSYFIVLDSKALKVYSLEMDGLK